MRKTKPAPHNGNGQPDGPLRLAVPLSPIPEGTYLSDHLESRLTMLQQIGLRRLWYGLRAANAVLADGRPISTNPQAVQWLLEQLGAATLPLTPDP